MASALAATLALALAPAARAQAPFGAGDALTQDVLVRSFSVCDGAAAAGGADEASIESLLGDGNVLVLDKSFVN